MLPDKDALRGVSASNQERLHTFITNTTENNYADEFNCYQVLYKLVIAQTLCLRLFDISLSNNFP